MTKQIKTTTVYTIAAGRAKYRDGKVSGNPALRSYTIAALIASGMASVSAAGRVTPRKSGSHDAFRALVGPTASKYWVKQGWTKDGALTAAGATVATSSLMDEKPKTAADLPLTRQFAAAMTKGGKVSFKDVVYSFDSATKLTG